jgi:hypothetical protein
LELPDNADLESFAWLNLLGVDRWMDFTPSFTSLTVVGTPTYTGRLRAIGRKIEFQTKLVSTISIASIAGTTYMALPVTPAKGFAGEVRMFDTTTNNEVGGGVIDITNNRAYMPLQPASSDTFVISGWYEV